MRKKAGRHHLDPTDHRKKRCRHEPRDEGFLTSTLRLTLDYRAAFIEGRF